MAFLEAYRRQVEVLIRVLPFVAEEKAFALMGEFLEGFLVALPGELDAVLGDRICDLRPRWAVGTSRLVAKMLAKHVEDFADRELSVLVNR